MCQSDITGEIAGHDSVIGIPGSPPWFSCQRCSAYRSTHAGLADLPCEPNRYESFDPSDRVSVGDELRARVDQALENKEGDRVVMGHTVESGVRFVVETSDWKVARGDEIRVRFDALGDKHKATIRHVVSTDDRVPSPTLTYVGSETPDSDLTSGNTR